MMNNKGQSLVLFIVVLPITLMILVLVYDVGRMSLLKNELNNINYMVIDSILSDKNVTDDDIRDLIIKNKSDIDKINIQHDDDKLHITLIAQGDSILPVLNNLKIYRIKSSYVGYVEDDKRVIERDK